MSTSAQWSLSFWVFHQNPICIPLLLPMRAAYLAHFVFLDLIIVIILGEVYKL
jgi:hypothetical protein